MPRLSWPLFTGLFAPYTKGPDPVSLRRVIRRSPFCAYLRRIWVVIGSLNARYIRSDSFDHPTYLRVRYIGLSSVMEGSFSGVMNQPDRGELGGNSMVVQQYARYPPTMEPALPSASSIDSSRSRVAASKSPSLQHKETPRSLQTSPTVQRSMIHRPPSVRSGPSMSPPVFDSMRQRQSRESMDQAEARTLPSRDITDQNIDDAYVAFIFYCNPNVPSSVDTSELRKTFRSPPRSDGKSFSIFSLWELIQKFDAKEVKTWIQLAIELGVEPPSVEKKQSTQKVQQYAVRLKRWMRAMHVDAFFEFCLGHPHPYYTQRPAANALVSDSRDGVPLEEDLALRALVPQWKPKRGRKRAEDKEDDEKPAKRPQLDTSVGILHGGPFQPHSAAFPQSAIPFSAFPDEVESHDPWMTATSAFPADAPHTQQGQDLRWRALERDASPANYPQSAIIPRGHHPSDVFLAAEPRSAITPPPGDKARSRRRHGPAVSSAWPSSNGSSTGKARGRPPNRGTVSGPFSSFPVNPAHDESSHGDNSARPASAVGMDQNSFGQFQSPSPFQQGGKPGKLQLQVPQNTGAPVRLATPPTVMVNGTDLSRAEPVPDTSGAQPIDTKPGNLYEELVRVLADEIRRADMEGRRSPFRPDEARGLANAVIKQVTSSLPNLSRASSTRLVAFHLGFGSLAGYQGPISGSTVVHGHSSAIILGANLPPGYIYGVEREYTYGSGVVTKVTYRGLRIEPEDKIDTASRTEEPNNIDELDGLSDAEFKVDGPENGVSDATWKQRYLRLRAQMQKKEKSLSQYKRRIMESVMAEI